MSVSRQFIELIKGLVPAYKMQLNEGCTDADILALETTVNQQLPESYKDLLKFCNGEAQGLHPVGLLGYFMLPKPRVAAEYNFVITNDYEDEEIEVTQPNLAKARKYKLQRVPFADDGSGNFLCFDFDPAEEGKVGQIIYLAFGEPDPITVVANSFDDFLLFLIEAMETGKVYPEETGSNGEAHLVNEWNWFDGWSSTEAKLLQ